MPRAQQSKESQIIGWFKTAPLASATVVLNLVKDEVKDRLAARATTVVPPKPKTSHHAKPTPVHVAPKRKKAKVKKSHHKAKPAPAAAQVEDFGGTDVE